VILLSKTFCHLPVKLRKGIFMSSGIPGYSISAGEDRFSSLAWTLSPFSTEGVTPKYNVTQLMYFESSDDGTVVGLKAVNLKRYNFKGYER
jgi:hypothetical protein